MNNIMADSIIIQNMLGISTKHLWLSLVVLFASLGFANAGSTYVYPLPESPTGTLTKIYGSIEGSRGWPPKLPKLDEFIDVRDAKSYLESHGIKFPKGGYALYFGRSHVLIVATTSDFQDILSFFLDS